MKIQNVCLVLLMKLPVLFAYAAKIDMTARLRSGFSTLNLSRWRRVADPASRVTGATGQRPYSSSALLLAKPKRGSVVESYRTVSVNCSKCRQRLFRYKKKNGTKSNLIKCYIERIAEDSAGVLENAWSEIQGGTNQQSGLPGIEALSLLEEVPNDYEWRCPSCQTQFARSAQIHGLPALKLVGGKVTMTKK